MADMQFDAGSVGYDGLGGPALTRLFGFIGAVCSVALVAGVVFWGYKLAVRDVTGVPVVRALEGPSRVQPENPGGQLAQHQGLAVNAVQTDEQIVEPELIVLAPPPIALEEGDNVGSVDLMEVTAEPVEAALPTVTNTSEAVAQALALADELAEGVAPLDPLRELEAEATPSPAVQIVPTTVAGVKISPRPNVRPKVDLAIIRQEAQPAQAQVTPVSAQLDLDAAAIPAGTRLVQLGAFDQRERAMEEWDLIAVKFADYMDGKSRVIQEAQSGGRSFYRLRAAGFDDLNASRRFCAVLGAAGASCIPVSAR